MTRQPDGDPVTRDLRRHVRWIGGGSGAGKSTIARKLADEHGLRVYSSDATLGDHIRRSDAVHHPLIHAFLAMDMDERWVDRPPSVMLETFHGFQGEAFEFIVEDLLALPGDPPILAEGFRLLPRLVAPLRSQLDQAVWLLPTRTSVGPPSTHADPRGRSHRRRAFRSERSGTYWSAIGCSRAKSPERHQRCRCR